MSCLKVLKGHENTTIKVIQLIIFVCCLTGFIIQSYDCILTFLACPQVVEISTQIQTSLDFPSISFCPVYYKMFKYGNPPAFDNSKLEQCGIDLESKFNGSGFECQDPKKIWEEVIPKFEDFGITEAKIGYLDQTQLHLSLDESDEIWSKMKSNQHGICYSLNLPKKLRQKPIFFIKFYIQASKIFEFFIHSKGSLVMDPNVSLDYKNFRIEKNKFHRFFVDYQQKNLLDFAGEACQSDDGYNYGKCIEDNIHQVNCM